ncbi:MAG: PLP-dependent aminotransferase family protein [Gammaproteobacteria bacterium]|nr:PLP-dependent aminotransferase family protein [Gammaproteobacteria bacterium]MCF6362955.1 PLP-dependent aminotransferase family protein [Gammaproteobacteria bacterium]
MKRYEQVAKGLAGQIEQGVYLPGERLPGVRRLSKQFSVSISTIMQAHQLLEDRGLIRARPRSGYYVRTSVWQVPEQPAMTSPKPRPTRITGQQMAMQLSQATRQPEMIQLGAAIPHHSFLPTQAINRALLTVTRHQQRRSASYEFPPGSAELRQQIARRMLDAGCQIAPSKIIITSGCQEALTLCLRAVAKTGDIIALESPTFYGLLQVVEALGLKALEIPTHPQHGISLDALKLAIEQWPVKACAIVGNFNSPMGYCMSEDNKQTLIKLLDQHDIPLIEDDVYGDLAFDHHRPKAAKSFDTNGNVLYCSSFSKTLSPGLRVGWMVPGKYQEQIEYLKYITSLATPTLPQLAIADFLQRSGYDRYLRQVRGQYARQVARITRAVSQHFPEGTRVTQPVGGFVIWVELPEGTDAMIIFHQALAKGISIAPGPIFSASQKYTNFIRINCAQPWDERLEAAIIFLGKLAQARLA